MNAFFEHHQHSIRLAYRCFDRLLLNGLIQPFQQPERVIGFFNTYREGKRVTRDLLHEIADQFKNWVTNRSKNHNLDGLGLLKHHEEEPLVLWAFQPGLRSDGTPRSLPPLSHADFVAATRTWVGAGMPCPTR